MTINDAANYQRKIYEFEIDVIRHIEMLAAAYMKKTDIPPEECELVVEMHPDKLSYSFQRRKLFMNKEDYSHLKIKLW